MIGSQPVLRTAFIDGASSPAARHRHPQTQRGARLDSAVAANEIPGATRSWPSTSGGGPVGRGSTPFTRRRWYPYDPRTQGVPLPMTTPLSSLKLTLNTLATLDPTNPDTSPCAGFHRPVRVVDRCRRPSDCAQRRVSATSRRAFFRADRCWSGLFGDGYGTRRISRCLKTTTSWM